MYQTLIFLHTTSTLQPPLMIHFTSHVSFLGCIFTLSYDQPEWVSQIILENNVFQRVFQTSLVHYPLLLH